MNEELLAEAKKYIGEPDYIVDLYDLTFIWASDNGLQLVGRPKEDIGKVRSVDIIAFNEQFDEAAFRKQLAERIGARHGEMVLPIKIKDDGTAKMTIEYQVFIFKGGWYIVGKVLKTEPISA